jgi:sialate O-acetylesterase
MAVASSPFRLSLLLGMLTIAPLLVDALNVSNVFSDYAVLQRDVPTRVWGWGEADEQVVVTLRSATVLKTYKVQADSVGLYIATLDAQPADWSVFNVTVQGSVSNNTVVLNDILFGDVYFCGGQSNMQISVSYALNATAEAQAANQYSNAIRLFSAPSLSGSAVPLNNLLGTAVWAPANNKTAPPFSGVCWYTGVNVYNQVKVPLGLVSVNWGGTPIQTWSKNASNTACDAPPATTPFPQCRASWLWNSMINPYIVGGGMPVKGFAWYQGENNFGQADYYKCALPKLIADWRTVFDSPDAYFGVIVLAPWISEQDKNGNLTEAADIRLAQLTVAGQTNVALINVLDDGDPQAPATSIHPRDKQLVGARVAASIIAMIYGQAPPAGGYLAPLYSRSTGSVAGTQLTASVYFQNDTLYDGLHWVPPQNTGIYGNSSRCRVDLGVFPDDCSWFEVQTSDGGWYNATATVSSDGQGVILSATANTTGLTITATRYGYSVWPVCNVYNSIGQPLFPWYAAISD